MQNEVDGDALIQSLAGQIADLSVKLATANGRVRALELALDAGAADNVGADADAG